MRLKRCNRCGKEFLAKKEWNYLCPECAMTVKRESVVRIRTCKQCGVEFSGGPRAWYCPECRKEHKRIQDREYKRAGKTSRPIGSTDLCKRCGAPYTVNSGNQMYCPDCREAAIRETVRSHKVEYSRNHQAETHARRAERCRESKVCVVCGKTFGGRGQTITCSDDCARKYKIYIWEKFDYARGKRKSPPKPFK